MVLNNIDTVPSRDNVVFSLTPTESNTLGKALTTIKKSILLLCDEKEIGLIPGTFEHDFAKLFLKLAAQLKSQTHPDDFTGHLD